MPKLKKDKKAEEAPAEQAKGQAPGQEQEKAPEREVQEPPKPPKESHLLVNILTVLLILLGIGELGLLGYMGFEAFRGMQARNLYEAQHPQDSEQTAAVTAASYLGPHLQVENGVVVWRSENNPLGPLGAGSSAAGLTAGGEGETRLANMTVPQIGYRLADEDEELST